MKEKNFQKRKVYIKKKRKVYIMALSYKEKLIVQKFISGSKSRSLKTQVVGRKMTFPLHLRKFHCILRTKKHDLSALKNAIR